MYSTERDPATDCVEDAEGAVPEEGQAMNLVPQERAV